MSMSFSIIGTVIRLSSTSNVQHQLRRSLLDGPMLAGSLNTTSRNLFKWLNPVFNNVDRDKIKEVGPDIAAAEWLIRNGAGVRWSNNSNGSTVLDTDYDHLEQKSSLDQIVEIDATNSSITHHGFEYLKNLKSLEKITLKKVKTLEDRALQLLVEYQPPQLKHLEVISCDDITDNGVLALKSLSSSLKYLKLEDLASVQNKPKCLEELQKSLQKSCKLEWN